MISIWMESPWGVWVHSGKDTPFDEGQFLGKDSAVTRTANPPAVAGRKAQAWRSSLCGTPQHPLHNISEHHLLSLKSCWVSPQKVAYELCPGIHICHYGNYPRNNPSLGFLSRISKNSSLAAQGHWNPFDGFLSLSTMKFLSYYSPHQERERHLNIWVIW